MKKYLLIATLLALVVMMLVPMTVQADHDESCFGLVAAYFGQEQEQGTHSSSFAGEPRSGLYRLAQYLYYEEGLLEEPTISALGMFLHDALGLAIEECQ